MPPKNYGPPGLPVILSGDSPHSSHSFSQPSINQINLQNSGVPTKFLFQPPPGKLNMSAMDVRDSRGILQVPMANLEENFNNSMMVGPNPNPTFPQQINYNPRNTSGLLNSPPNLNPPQLNQTQPYFYQMNSSIDMNQFPSTKVPQFPTKLPPPPPVKKEENKEPEIFKKTKNFKTSLKTGSRSFKPTGKKIEANSFIQPQPRQLQSYMNATLPGSQSIQPPIISQGNFSQKPYNFLNPEFPPPPQNMNSTFNGVLPGMLPPPPMPSSSYPPQMSLPQNSSISSMYNKPVAPPPSISGSQLTGRVKYFKPEHNYGFIIADKDGENIFFHYSEMKSQSISKEALFQAKDKYIIRLVFQVMKYVGKYKLSKKAINIFVTEFSDVNNGSVISQNQIG